MITMLSNSMNTTKFLIATAFLLTVTDSSLCSFELELFAISGVPHSQLDTAPMSSPPNLPPDVVKPLFPSPGESLPTTIPSNPSTRSRGELDSPGPNSARSPSGSFGADASTSGAASLSAGECSEINCVSVVLFFCVLLLA